MGLEIKKGSNWWYGRFRVEGKIKQINLEIPIEGARPATVSGVGDRVFEQSRGKAQQELDRKVKELLGDPMAEKAVQRLVEIKTG